jgi:hypothetical protein
MNTAELILFSRTYLEMAALLALGGGLLSGLSLAVQKYKVPMRFRTLLGLGQLVILFSLLLPVGMFSLPRHALFRPSVQVWSGAHRERVPDYAWVSTAPESANVDPRVSGLLIRERGLVAALLLFFAGFLAQGAAFAIRLQRLRRGLKGYPVVRRQGAVWILAASEIGSPFSFWSPGHCVIALPMDFLANRQDLMMALRHEARHHRNGDTRWAWLHELLKAAFFWNPAVYFLTRQISQIQEFACDEFLIGHRKLSPQAYGSCLVRAAESAIHSRLVPVGTAGMAESLNGSTLKRRIAMLFNDRKSESRWAFAAIAAGTLTVMVSLAYASQSLVQDRALTLDEAREYAKKAIVGTEVPIDINDRVLAKLNMFVGTPEGRKWASSALSRVPNYRGLIEQKASEYGMPEELIAIAMYESALDNDAVSPKAKSKGIWQFIAATARRYDLKVTDQQDERTDPEKETVAAMRLLGDLHGEFKDWRLAFMGYNEGQQHVNELITRYGTRDPWALERIDPYGGYLSGAIAMMIIYKNPSLIH